MHVRDRVDVAIGKRSGWRPRRDVKVLGSRRPLAFGIEIGASPQAKRLSEHVEKQPQRGSPFPKARPARSRSRAKADPGLSETARYCLLNVSLTIHAKSLAPRLETAVSCRETTKMHPASTMLCAMPPLLGRALGCFERLRDEGRDRHRPDAAWHRRER